MATITTMKLTPQAIIMSTRVSWNQLINSWPTPLPAPSVSPTWRTAVPVRASSLRTKAPCGRQG